MYEFAQPTSIWPTVLGLIIFASFLSAIFSMLIASICNQKLAVYFVLGLILGPIGIIVTAIVASSKEISEKIEGISERK